MTMENKINIAELLKDAPKGTTLWSPLFGECTLGGVGGNNIRAYPTAYGLGVCNFTAYGQYYGFPDAECLLFPSKECRTWENFSAPWGHKHFKPFQRVLVARTTNNRHIWRGAIYSHYDTTHEYHILADGYVKSDMEILPYLGNEDKLGKEVG